MSGSTGDGRKTARSLITILGIAAILALAGGLMGLRAFATQAPPEKLSDEELLTRVARAPEKAPDFGATVTVEQGLIPAQLLSAMGQGEGSASSGPQTARVWYGGPNKVRAELQGETGDRLFVQNGARVWAYDGATNTLKVGEHDPGTTAPRGTVSPAEVDEVLAELAPTSKLTQEPPVRFADRLAYVLTLTPRDAGSTMVERAQAFIDAETYLPLQLSLYADGSPDPVFSWRVSDFDVGPIAAGRFGFEVPPGAEVIPLDREREEGRQPEPHDGAKPTEVETVAEAQRSVDFEVRELSNAPGGRELTGVYVKGGGGVVLTYGSGWGTVVLAEGPALGPRGKDAANLAPGLGDAARGGLRLPTVDLGGGVEAQEISTPVGAGLRWSEGGVSYVLAGSVPASELQRAARGMR